MDQAKAGTGPVLRPDSQPGLYPLAVDGQCLGSLLAEIP